MKLSNWAKEQGLAYGTVLKWFHNKTLPFPSEQLDTGTILVYPNKDVKENFQKTFIYARVSSTNKKSDLNSQAELCERYCISRGWKIEKIYKEIASGMNDNRSKLNKILDSENIRVVCLHKDRITRFGFNYIEKCLISKNSSIEIINSEKTDEDDLLKDFIAIITSFCCRLYGARRGQAKCLKMKGSLKND
jgi:predicted site-specific integrase-resolvase